MDDERAAGWVSVTFIFAPGSPDLGVSYPEDMDET
jgi:hypothetical protein